MTLDFDEHENNSKEEEEVAILPSQNYQPAVQCVHPSISPLPQKEHPENSLAFHRNSLTKSPCLSVNKRNGKFRPSELLKSQTISEKTLTQSILNQQNLLDEEECDENDVNGLGAIKKIRLENNVKHDEDENFGQDPDQFVDLPRDAVIDDGYCTPDQQNLRPQRQAEIIKISEPTQKLLTSDKIHVSKRVNNDLTVSNDSAKGLLNIDRKSKRYRDNGTVIRNLQQLNRSLNDKNKEDKQLRKNSRN